MSGGNNVGVGGRDCEGCIQAKFNGFMIWARRHKIAILFGFIILLSISTVSLSVLVGKIYNDLFDNKNITISGHGSILTGYNHVSTELGDTTSEFKNNFITIETALMMLKNVMFKNVSDIVKTITDIDNKHTSYKTHLRNNITSIVSKMDGNLEMVTRRLNNTDTKIHDAVAHDGSYKKLLHANITSLITLININKKRNEKMNGVLGRNITRFNERVVSSNNVLGKKISIIQKGHDGLKFNITEIKELISEFTTGYKVFWKKCPQNWTTFGHLNPIYICFRN